MSNNIPDAIIEAIAHFTERANASKDLQKLANEFRSMERPDFGDLESMEQYAKLFIELVEKQYQAGLLSEPEYVAQLYHAVVALIHENRWTNGFYSSELDPIAEKMRVIEKEYGLSSDQYWAKGDAPLEHQLLNQEYDRILDSKLEAEFVEFAPRAISDQFTQDKESLDELFEAGRRSIHIKDHIKRLKELSSLYEVEAVRNEEAKAYFSATIMLAAAIEGRLLAQCLENAETVRNVLTQMGLLNKKLKSKNPLDWSLDTLIDVCSNAGWLPNIETPELVVFSDKIAHILRSTRNLVHPGRHIKRKSALSIGEEQFKDTQAAYNLISKLLSWPRAPVEPTADTLGARDR